MIACSATPAEDRPAAQLGSDRWHRVDDVLQVFVHVNEAGTGWQLDESIVDGRPLTGIGVDAGECECTDQVGHARAVGHATLSTPYPTAEALMRLLADALGFEVRPRA
ncbi:hypothetical protein [Prescottella equi]|uniref:hypothetical protein n=1 Tax=Rhodococcus hoagii TaxID=43767 RepID=UPI000D0F1511|nr:hypothetical protein [Prescottella equi]AVP71323.1 hypothetical protein C7H75_24895 [Prescottella equi]